MISLVKAQASSKYIKKGTARTHRLGNFIQKMSKQFSAPPANTGLYTNKRNSRSLDLGPPPSQDPQRPAIHRSTSDPPAPNTANNHDDAITAASPESTATHSSNSTHVDDDANKGSGFFQLRIRPPTRKTSVRVKCATLRLHSTLFLTAVAR